MTTADAAVRAALSVVGQTEDPPGSNHCPITRELDATFPRVPLSGGGTSTRGGTSWCGSFTFWALWKSGYPVDPRGCLVVNGVDIWDFYTPADVNAWKKAGRWLDWRETPPVGALVYYDWQGTHGTTSLTDHVGIVTAVSPDGTFISTVEGNTSPGGFVSNGGGVYAFGPHEPGAPARPRSSMVGFGLPLYSTAPSITEDDMAVLIQDELGNWFRAGDSVRNIGNEEIKALRAAGCPEALEKATGWEAWTLRRDAGITPNPQPAS